jgi:hypothetical protein
MKHRERAAFAARSALGDLLPSLSQVAGMPTEPDAYLERFPGLLAMARKRMRTRHLALRTEQA